jgi:hypothetical protein
VNRRPRSVSRIIKAKISANGTGATGGRLTEADMMEKARVASSIARLEKKNGLSVGSKATDDLRADATVLIKIDINIIVRRLRSRCRRSR